MKRSVWFVGLVLVSGVCARVVWAGVAVQGGDVGSFSTPIRVVTVTSDTASAGDFGAGRYIVGFKMVATGSSASCTLYDVATLQGTANSNVIDELAEVNASATALQIWPNPYQLTTDLTVDVADANCLIYYY